MSSYRISQVAERSGVPASTLRYYEREGLLPAERTAAGYRAFGDDVFGRLSFIASAKRVGIPLGEIAGLLRTWQDGSCAEVRDTLRPLLDRRIGETRHRLEKWAELADVQDSAATWLAGLPARDGGCDRRCEFPDAEPVIACSLDAPGVRERLGRWHLLLDGLPRRDIPHGVTFTLPAERVAEAAELALAEHGCCPFLRFELRTSGAGMELTIHAPAAASPLLAEMFPG